METKPKAKRKLKEISFDGESAHIALVSKEQGGPANGADYSLILKNTEGRSQEFIEKASKIQVTMDIVEFIERFFSVWGSDALVLASLMGYEKEESEDDDWDYDDWIQEKVNSFQILKGLNEADNKVSALSKLTEQDYLSVLTDQAVIEKALTELAKGSVPNVDTSTTNVEKQVEASASRKKNKEKNMTQATPEMVEKSALTAIEKAMEDTKVELQKALAQVKQFEEEKKQAVVKSKTDAVTALVKDAKQAEVLVKAALALDTQEDFEALVGVVKALVEQVDKSDLFKEVGASASADETKTEESSLTKLIKSKFNKE